MHKQSYQTASELGRELLLPSPGPGQRRPQGAQGFCMFYVHTGTIFAQRVGEVPQVLAWERFAPFLVRRRRHDHDHEPFSR